MKLITWNVAGLRAILSKNIEGKRDTNDSNALQSIINEYNPDIICLQETKCPIDMKTNLEFPFSKIIASTTKKGYSGVGIFSKIIPLNIIEFPLNEEGRVICLEFDNFYLINAYVPNSKPDLSRLDYRINTWELTMREYINKLQEHKPIIYVGDFNTAPTEIDIHTVKGHDRSAGFTIEERTSFSQMLEKCKLVDSYRLLHPTQRKYTYFSNFGKARQNNKGWRIDGALLSNKIKKHIKKTDILSDVYGSDHVPYLLEIDI
jgi:exodeoxyribonuclease-3